MDAARILRGEISMDDLAFKLPADGKVFGGKIPRPSALAKVTGTCDYGADLGLKLPPDTLQLALVQATISHANILSIDASEAENMPGVYKVVTHKDVKGKNRITGLITFPTNKGCGFGEGVFFSFPSSSLGTHLPRKLQLPMHPSTYPMVMTQPKLAPLIVSFPRSPVGNAYWSRRRKHLLKVYTKC